MDRSRDVCGGRVGVALVRNACHIRLVRLGRHLRIKIIATGRFEAASLLHWSRQGAKSNHFARLGGWVLSPYLCCIDPQEVSESTTSDASEDGFFARTSVALIRKGCQNQPF